MRHPAGASTSLVVEASVGSSAELRGNWRKAGLPKGLSGVLAQGTLFTVESFLPRPPPPHRRYAAGFRWVVCVIAESAFPSMAFSPRVPGFIARRFRGVGVGFEEPHLQLKVY